MPRPHPLLLFVAAFAVGCAGYSDRREGDPSDDDDSADDDDLGDDDVGDDDDLGDDDTASSGCGLPPGTTDFGPAVGQYLADIEVQRADGSTSSIYELCGQVTLLDVDAMWNAPGIQGQPVLEDLYQEYRSSGLEVATILLDGEAFGTPPALADLEDWVTDHALSFAVVRADRDDVVDSLVEQAEGFYIPYLIVLDRDLRIDSLTTGIAAGVLEDLVQDAFAGR